MTSVFLNNQAYSGDTIIEPMPANLNGTWKAIQTNQSWRSLEINNNQIQIQTNTGTTLKGTIKPRSEEQCSLQLTGFNTSQELEATWCLWHGVLDLLINGKYMIFSCKT